MLIGIRTDGHGSRRPPSLSPSTCNGMRSPPPASPRRRLRGLPLRKARRSPVLETCLRALRSGNTLVVWKLDRLGRDLPHLVAVVSDLAYREVGLQVLTGRGTAIDHSPALSFQQVLPRHAVGGLVGARQEFRCLENTLPGDRQSRDARRPQLVRPGLAGGRGLVRLVLRHD